MTYTVFWMKKKTFIVFLCGLIFPSTLIGPTRSLWWLWSLNLVLDNTALSSIKYVTCKLMNYKKLPAGLSNLLCPSLAVPNEDELTIRVCTGDHSWSFSQWQWQWQSSVLMRVASASQYESFEHVQKILVPSANNFHSCLCASKTCSYRLCYTAYLLYSSRSHYILRHSWM